MGRLSVQLGPAGSLGSTPVRPLGRVQMGQGASIIAGGAAGRPLPSADPAAEGGADNASLEIAAGRPAISETTAALEMLSPLLMWP